ncbi:MAG: hypothetical protein R3E31_05565 [Chloroflexota bacterium]
MSPPLLATCCRGIRIALLGPSCSGFIMLLGVRAETPQLAHHNIFFNRHYRAEFDAIFRRACRQMTRPF